MVRVFNTTFRRDVEGFLARLGDSSGVRIASGKADLAALVRYDQDFRTRTKHAREHEYVAKSAFRMWLEGGTIVVVLACGTAYAAIARLGNSGDLCIKHLYGSLDSTAHLHTLVQVLRLLPANRVFMLLRPDACRAELLARHGFADMGDTLSAERRAALAPYFSPRAIESAHVFECVPYEHNRYEHPVGRYSLARLRTKFTRPPKFRTHAAALAELACAASAGGYDHDWRLLTKALSDELLDWHGGLVKCAAFLRFECLRLGSRMTHEANHMNDVINHLLRASASFRAELERARAASAGHLLPAGQHAPLLDGHYHDVFVATTRLISISPLLLGLSRARRLGSDHELAALQRAILVLRCLMQGECPSDASVLYAPLEVIHAYFVSLDVDQLPLGAGAQRFTRFTHYRAGHTYDLDAYRRHLEQILGAGCDTSIGRPAQLTAEIAVATEALRELDALIYAAPSKHADPAPNAALEPAQRDTSTERMLEFVNEAQTSRFVNGTFAVNRQVEQVLNWMLACATMDRCKHAFPGARGPAGPARPPASDEHARLLPSDAEHVDDPVAHTPLQSLLFVVLNHVVRDSTAPRVVRFASVAERSTHCSSQIARVRALESFLKSVQTANKALLANLVAAEVYKIGGADVLMYLKIDKR